MNSNSLTNTSGDPTDFDCNSINNLMNIFVASSFTSCFSTEILVWPVCNISKKIIYTHILISNLSGGRVYRISVRYTRGSRLPDSYRWIYPWSSVTSTVINRLKFMTKKVFIFRDAVSTVEVVVRIFFYAYETWATVDQVG